MRIMLTFVLLTLPTAVLGQSARDLVVKSGIQGGLVVQMGSGDRPFTTELLANDSFVVHGLCSDRHKELLSIVVDQFLSRRRFWALQVPVPLLCSGFDRGGLPSLDPWHVAAQRVTQIDGGLVDRDVLHGSVQLELVAV